MNLNKFARTKKIISRQQKTAINDYNDVDNVVCTELFGGLFKCMTALK